MNRVIFVGNLASDVDTRTTNSGKTCALFRLAVQRIRSNKDGQHEADFFPVVAWGKTAELCVRFLSKGRKVAIDGRLQTRSLLVPGNDAQRFGAHRARAESGL